MLATIILLLSQKYSPSLSTEDLTRTSPLFNTLTETIQPYNQSLITKKQNSIFKGQRFTIGPEISSLLSIIIVGDS
jgi:hypothetical protein